MPQIRHRHERLHRLPHTHTIRKKNILLLEKTLNDGRETNHLMPSRPQTTHVLRAQILVQLFQLFQLLGSVR